MRSVIAATALLAAVLVGYTPAGAGAGNRFDGNCTFQLTFVYTPALAVVPVPTSQAVSGTGVCTGTWRDASGASTAVANEPASYTANTAGSLSCVGGTATGTAAVSTRLGSISMTQNELHLTALATVMATGALGGQAFGTLAVSSPPVPTALACATALSSVQLRLVLRATALTG